MLNLFSFLVIFLAVFPLSGSSSTNHVIQHAENAVANLEKVSPTPQDVQRVVQNQAGQPAQGINNTTVTSDEGKSNQPTNSGQSNSGSSGSGHEGSIPNDNHNVVLSNGIYDEPSPAPQVTNALTPTPTPEEVLPIDAPPMIPPTRCQPGATTSPDVSCPELQ